MKIFGQWLILGDSAFDKSCMTIGKPTVLSKRQWLNILVLIIFCAGIGLFGVLRATHEYRWGGWAIGDAQNLNAAIHFAKEGFRKHYFLTYYHPGYLGESYGTETKLGYYTHYPPLSAILNGIIARCLGEDLLNFRGISVLFSVFWLIIFYFFISVLIDSPTALLTILFMGVSAGFLDYMDGVSPYTYSEFFVYGGLLLLVLSEKKTGFWKYLLLSCSWGLIFLESLNSFDYYFFTAAFIAGYGILLAEKRSFPFLKTFSYGMALVLGFGLHVLQNAVAMGGLNYALQDLHQASGPRLMQLEFMGIIKDLLNFAVRLNGYLPMNYGLNAIHAGILLLGVLYVNYKSKIPSARVYKVLFLFTLSVMIWWMIAMRAFDTLGQEMSRQIFPVIFILLSTLIISTFKLIMSEYAKPFLKIAAGCFMLVAIYIPLKNTWSYLEDYPNFIQPGRSWGISQPREKLIEGIDLSKRIKEKSQFGDIIIVPKDFLWWQHQKQPNPIYEYYSQRRMDYIGTDKLDFKEKLNKVDHYIQQELPQIIGRKEQIGKYIVLRTDVEIPYQKELLAYYRNRTQSLQDRWVLIRM